MTADIWGQVLGLAVMLEKGLGIAEMEECEECNRLIIWFCTMYRSNGEIQEKRLEKVLQAVLCTLLRNISHIDVHSGGRGNLLLFSKSC